jgi:flavin reductase (DIM6/NTAB) family NADH-FMN oxidoreductase RutF
MLRSCQGLKREANFSRVKVDQIQVKENVGRAIGRLASGVHVLTCERQEQAHGILMTWISQAAFEPPSITVAVKVGRPILSELTEGSQFVVNVLAKTNSDIFKNFAKPDVPSDQRFAGLNLLPKTSFGPVFSAAVAYMNCRVYKVVEAGDHNLIVAEVVGGEVLNPDAEPMTHLRRSGFQY